MFNPKTNYAKIAFDTILFYVSTGQTKKENLEKISGDLKLNCACIVSIYDSADDLRGRFGDIKPTGKILYEEIVENAVAAASGNENFNAIQSNELNHIKVIVDVPSVLHEVENVNDLQPKKHGLYIRNKRGKDGFILPDTKGVNTVSEQIERIKSATGIKETDNSKLEIKFFKSTRYD